MENKILIGFIVGLIFYLWLYVYNSNRFSPIQKRIIILLLIFPPIGIPALVFVLVYNSSINEKSNKNNKTESKTEDFSYRISENNIDKELSLKNKKDELKHKIELIEKAYHNKLLNKLEYIERKNLLEDEYNIISKELDDYYLKIEIISKNAILFNDLIELKNSNIITEKDFKFKYDTLLNRLIRSKIKEITIEKTILEIADNKEGNLQKSQSIINKKTVLIFFSILLTFFGFWFIKAQYIKLNQINIKTIQLSTVADKNILQNLYKNEKFRIKKNQLLIEKIYLGKHEFHYQENYSFGMANITKHKKVFKIKGVHNIIRDNKIYRKVSIDGEILRPKVDGFKFKGYLTIFDPSHAKFINEMNEFPDFPQFNSKYEHINDEETRYIETTAKKINWYGEPMWRIILDDCSELDCKHNKRCFPFNCYPEKKNMLLGIKIINYKK